MPARTRRARFPNAFRRESDFIEQPFDIPDSAEPVEEPDDPSELEDFDFDPDDDEWDVFIADDDEVDPEPDRGDFWNDEFPNDE
jgi:hypothetical protein